MAVQRRRRFLKSTGAIVAGTAIAGAAVAGSARQPVASGFRDKDCDRGPNFSPVRPDPAPYLVDDKVYRRFSAAETCFNRSRRSGRPDYRDATKATAETRLERGDPGFSVFDLALGDAVKVVGASLSFAGCAYDYRLDEKGYSFADGEPTAERRRAIEPGEAASRVKKAARFLGADLVGICPINERWLYSEVWLDDTKRRAPLALPASYTTAVVMAFAMDFEAVATSPSGLAAAASALGYTRMAITATGLAAFIRNLGFRAVASGNDTALSVPMAVDAGLGEWSRTGLLVTPEYGARVRLAKVFTDLPLEPDQPITFGVRHFCGTCRKCAKTCPAHAISADDEPRWSGPSVSNNPGVYKWYVDVDRCLAFWTANGSDCLSCVVACPFNGPPSPWRQTLISTVSPGTGRAWIHTGATSAPDKRPDPAAWWDQDIM